MNDGKSNQPSIDPSFFIGFGHGWTSSPSCLHPAEAMRLASLRCGGVCGTRVGNLMSI